jgi:hypothetical protein
VEKVETLRTQDLQESLAVLVVEEVITLLVVVLQVKDLMDNQVEVLAVEEAALVKPVAQMEQEKAETEYRCL